MCVQTFLAHGMMWWKLEITCKEGNSTTGGAIRSLRETCGSVKESSGPFDLCLPLSDSLAQLVIKMELSL